MGLVKEKLANAASFQESRLSFTLPYKGKTLGRFCLLPLTDYLYVRSNKGKETKIEFFTELMISVGSSCAKERYTYCTFLSLVEFFFNSIFCGNLNKYFLFQF